MSEGAARTGMSPRRFAAALLKISGGLLVAVLALLLVASIVGVRIPIHRLSGLLGPVVEGLGASAEYAEGSYLELSLTPSIRLEEFRLAAEFSALSVAHVSGAIELLPLFRQQLVIRDARVETGRLEISRQPGFGGGQAPEADPEPKPFELSPWLRSLVVDTARVTDVTAIVRHEDSGAEWAFAVIDLSLEMPRPGDVTAAVGGAFQGVTFDLEAQSQRRAPDVWALEQLTLRGDGFGMQLTGHADPRGGNAAGLFEVRVDNSAAVRAVFGSAFVPFSPFLLKADWDYADGRGNLVFDNLIFGPTGFDGSIDLDLNGPVPALNVDLETAEIDLAEWTARMDDASKLRVAETPPAAESETAGKESPPLADMLGPWLDSARVDAEVRVGSFGGAVLPVTDFSLGFTVGEETLTLPVSAVMGGVPFRGGIGVQIDGDLVRVEVPLVGPPSDASELLRLLFAVDDLAGSHEGLRVVTSAQGRTFGELVESVRLNAIVQGARLSYGTRPVSFSLDSMELQSSTRERTSVTGAGKLLGQPFEITARSDSLAELADRRSMRFDAEVTGPGTRLTALAARDGSRETLELGLESSNTGVLRDWLGLLPAEPTTIALGVRLAADGSGDGLEYRIDPLRVGGSSVRLAGVLKHPDGRAAVSARVRGDVVDVRDFQNLFAAAPSEGRPLPEARTGTLALDAPILPARVSIVDADLDVALGRLAYAPLELADVSVIGRARNGQVKSAAVSAGTAYGALNGSASADLRTDRPRIQASLELAPFRFGRVLADLAVVESSGLSFERASMDLDVAGETLAELLRSASVDLRVTGGRVPLVPELDLEADVAEASLRNAPGEPIALGITGAVRDEPLAVSLRVPPLAELIDTRKLAMQVTGKLGASELAAEFAGPLPLGSGRSDLRLEAQADGLDAWNDLLGLDLPPWGPVALSGALTHQRPAYRLNDVLFSVGASDLRGRVEVDLAGKPRVDVHLSAPMIQLEDFRTEGWDATKGIGNDAETTDDPPAAHEPGPGAPALASPEMFQRVDATLALDVEEVRSGPDQLGAGQLRAYLLDGVFEVPTLSVQTPAGDAAASGRLAWAGPRLMDASMALRAERFDYGILARRIDPTSQMKGELTVNADLRSRYPVGQSFMSHADGVLQFGVWPVDFKAGIFDLWAIGLLSAVMPKFSDDAVSTMNCVIGSFRLTDGILSEDAFLADSSKIQVTGETTADFQVREVDAYLSPKAKRAQIFSIGTPVEITGDFDDFNVGFRGGDLALAVLRFVTSPVVAPIRWLVEDPLPPDGAAACRNAWETVARASGTPRSGEAAGSGAGSADGLDFRR